MLYKFLVVNRERILALVKEKTVDIAEDKPTTEEAERGLPEFYDHLVYEMRRESKGLPKSSEKSAESKHGQHSTAIHGKELSRLGYTVSQVVHGYGVLCQAVTEVAETMKVPISASEFSVLNLSLDIAIADAVTGFSKRASIESVDSTKRMGFLVHELRNALAAAIIAHSLVKKGVVGVGGSTNALLEKNLNRARDIVDRSFSEVRMQNDKVVDLQPVSLIKIVEEVEATASEEARSRGLSIKVKVDRQLQVDVDRHYMVSALSNLVQNAIKYSKQDGTIWVRSRDTDKNIVLEVEDQCGGLPKGKSEELFKPFTQKNPGSDGSRARPHDQPPGRGAERGALAVRDFPGKGCIFSITLPKQKNSDSPPRPRRHASQVVHRN
jgi:signal transduction histidine kinase